MPTYHYQCKNCDESFDRIHTYDNRAKPENEPCPSCGKVSVSYIIVPPKISYSHKGSLKTTDSFNDRLKEIKNKLPEEYKGRINSVIR